MKKWRIALAQMDSGEDVDQNLGKMVRFIREAKAQGADLVAFPEFSHFLMFSRDRVYFESRQGRTTRLLINLAKELDIAIHVGSLLLDSGTARPYNESFLISKSGQIHGRYRKIHLFKGLGDQGQLFEEAALYTPGDQLVVDAFEDFIFASQICYDFRFPEPFRILRDLGAKVIFVPGNFTMVARNHFIPQVLQTRALENQVYIISADQVGEKKKTISYGHSMVVSPTGEILAMKEAGEGLVFADIDLGLVDRLRLELPLWETRRPKVYGKYWP